MGLPRVVCEYEDVFLNELLGLPPHRDVDFVIELHPGMSPISMTPHRMAPVEYRNSRSNCKDCWTRALLDAHFTMRRFSSVCEEEEQDPSTVH